MHGCATTQPHTPNSFQNSSSVSVRTPYFSAALTFVAPGLCPLISSLVSRETFPLTVPPNSLTIDLNSSRPSPEPSSEPVTTMVSESMFFRALEAVLLPGSTPGLSPPGPETPEEGEEVAAGEDDEEGGEEEVGGEGRPRAAAEEEVEAEARALAEAAFSSSV
jgi:hypothetical protein